MPVDFQKIKSQKFACLSVAVSLLEASIVWGGVAVGLALPSWNWHWLGGVFHYTIMIGLGSIVFAIVGLFRDPERMFAFLALVLGLFVSGICTLPLSG
jgi:hypothetical protein